MNELYTKKEYYMIEKYVYKNENTASRIIDGQAVIMTLDNNTLHTLNETGTRIWELCDGKRRFKDIVKIIHEEYSVEYEYGETDCEIFLQDLINKGMLILWDKIEEH